MFHKKKNAAIKILNAFSNKNAKKWLSQHVTDKLLSLTTEEEIKTQITTKGDTLSRRYTTTVMLDSPKSLRLTEPDSPEKKLRKSKKEKTTEDVEDEMRRVAADVEKWNN